MAHTVTSSRPRSGRCFPPFANAIAGFAWVILSLTAILLPQVQDKAFTITQTDVFREIAFMFWLVIKGAKPPALDATASSGVAA